MILAAFAAAVAFAASGPPAFDQAISCHVPVRGGLPVVDLSTEPTGWYVADGVRKPRVATFDLATNSFGANRAADYVMFQSGPHIFGPVKDAPCSKAPAVPLAAAGLPRYGTVKAPSDGIVNAVNLSCFTGATIAVRQHLQIAGSRVVSAQVAVRTGKKLRPLLYVEWTPAKVTVYAAGDCHE